MKIILCGINAKYIHSNLAIFSLKTYAEKKEGIENVLAIKEYTINHYVENILRDLYEECADVIAFSCYIWNISYVRELAAELKKVSPHTAIWVGGPEVSYDSVKFLRENPSVDLVMRGEGEKVFAKLVKLYQKNYVHMVSEGQIKKEMWQEVPEQRMQGVVLRAGSEMIDGGFAPLMNLDEIPFVYEDFDPFTHKIIYYESSRGCPFSCSYCLSSIDKTVRFRSLNKVEKELSVFLDAGVDQVKFVDRTFNAKKSHAMAIWNYILEHDNGVTNFHFEISADLLDQDALELFKKMRPGLIQLEIGVQSTYDKTVEAIQRKMDLKKVFSNVDRVHKMGNIHQHLDLIAGLPEESLEQFKQSFNDLYVHEPDQLQLGFLKILKGTVMEEKALEYDLLYRDNPPYEVLSTKWLSFDELILLKGVEELVELYYNSGQYVNTLHYIMPCFETPFSFYEQFSDYYRKNDYYKMNHNRMKKYEILRDFLKSERLNLPYLDQMMILDLYLRENIKTRPSWAKDLSPYKNIWKQWYKEKGRDVFYREGAVYDSKKVANSSHIEPFSFDVMLWEKEGRIAELKCFVIFDYSKKHSFTKDAKMTIIPEIYF